MQLLSDAGLTYLRSFIGYEASASMTSSLRANSNSLAREANRVAMTHVFVFVFADRATNYNT